MNRSRKPETFLRKHSLSLVALGVVLLLIALYCRSNPNTHLGSFFGNAIADWSGVLVTVAGCWPSAPWTPTANGVK
jgi:hypothetical protein